MITKACHTTTCALSGGDFSSRVAVAESVDTMAIIVLSDLDDISRLSLKVLAHLDQLAQILSSWIDHSACCLFAHALNDRSRHRKLQRGIICLNLVACCESRWGLSSSSTCAPPPLAARCGDHLDSVQVQLIDQDLYMFRACRILDSIGILFHAAIGNVLPYRLLHVNQYCLCFSHHIQSASCQCTWPVPHHCQQR